MIKCNQTTRYIYKVNYDPFCDIFSEYKMLWLFQCKSFNS